MADLRRTLYERSVPLGQAWWGSLHPCHGPRAVGTRHSGRPLARSWTVRTVAAAGPAPAGGSRPTVRGRPVRPPASPCPPAGTPPLLPARRSVDGHRWLTGSWLVIQCESAVTDTEHHKGRRLTRSCSQRRGTESPAAPVAEPQPVRGSSPAYRQPSQLTCPNLAKVCPLGSPYRAIEATLQQQGSQGTRVKRVRV